MLQSSADRLPLCTLYILKTRADKILLFATILNQVDPVRVQEDHTGGGVVVPCKRQTTHEEAEYSFCMYPKMLPHFMLFAVHRNQIAFSGKIAGFFSLRVAVITRGYYNQ